MSSRRANTFSLEYFVALAVFMMIALLMFSYVEQSVDATGYFQEFYAHDLSLLSEVGVASPGDLVVTYDNLKGGFGFGYEFGAGRVSVLLEDLSEDRFFGVYDGLSVPPSEYVDPSFLTLIKTGDDLVLRESTGYLQGCTLSERAINDVQLSLTTQDDREAFVRGAHEVLQQSPEEPPIIREEGATLTFSLAYDDGGDPLVRVQHGGGVDESYLACLLRRQFEAYTTSEIVVEEAALEEGTIAVSIAGVVLEERLVGQLVGRSVVIYERQ